MRVSLRFRETRPFLQPGPVSRRFRRFRRILVLPVVSQGPPAGLLRSMEPAAGVLGGGGDEGYAAAVSLDPGRDGVGGSPVLLPFRRRSIWGWPGGGLLP